MFNIAVTLVFGVIALLHRKRSKLLAKAVKCPPFVSSSGPIRVIAKHEDCFAILRDEQEIWKVQPTAESNSYENRIASIDKTGNWKLIVENNEFHYYKVENDQRLYDVEVVFPITDKLVERYSQKKPRKFKRESPSDYALRVKQSPNWVESIIKGEKEVDRVLFRNDQFLIAVDSKWRDYPEGKDAPYLLAISIDKALYTIRELRADHINILKQMKQEAIFILTSKCGDGVDPLAVRSFFHYPPQFDWLHVHFCMSNDPRADVAFDRAHALDDVMANLNRDSLFYANAEITIII